jgi:hypothetical protein
LLQRLLVVLGELDLLPPFWGHVRSFDLQGLC